MWGFVSCGSSAVFLIVQLVLLSQSNVSANEFYVVPDNGFNCPMNRSCETINYYINYQTRYFVSDTIFYFLEGTHFIQPEQTLLITLVNNITFLGLGRQTLGFHETVTQSTAILQCESPTSNIVFMLSTSINISSLTITNCGRMLPDEFYIRWYLIFLINENHTSGLSLYYSNITLAVLEVFELNIYQLSIQNGSGYGFATINSHHLVIANSSFSQNTNEACYNISCQGGNIGIFYTNTVQCYAGITYFYMYNVNFSFGFSSDRYFGSGGLLITLDQTEMYLVAIALFNIRAFANTAVGGGGNMALVAFTDAKYALFINNMVSSYGNKDLSLRSDLLNTAGGLNILNGMYRTTKLRNCGTQLRVRNPIAMKNSIFHSNFGISAGGLDISFLSADNEINQFVQIENTHFFKNGGKIAQHISFFSYTIGMTAPVSIHFKNVIASYGVSNEEYQALSAITFFQAYNATFSGIKVEHNEGSGILATQSSITFYDINNLFRNNSGVRGAGMNLVGNSYIILKLPTTIYFIDNHATQTGGAINVEQLMTIACFFQVIIPDPLNYTITNEYSGLYFQNNTAEEAGLLLYGGGIDQCLLLGSTLVGFVFRNSTKIFDTFFHYEIYFEDISQISSYASRVCFCDIQNRPNCDVSSKAITVYPGEEISIPLITVGQRNGAAMGTLKAVEIAKGHQISEVLQSWQPACSYYNYTVNINTSIGDYNSSTIYLSTDVTPSNIIIEIDILDCPPGFMLSDRGKCICSHELTNTFTDTLCDLENQLISTQGGVWMKYNSKQSCIIAHSSCPFDYCTLSEVTFDITEPDEQCAFNRSGLLCGECAKGLSLLLGSNQCGECTNDYISLLIPFSFAGIALVASLILLNLTVSIGTINGLIFFANIVKLNETVYFPNGPIIFLSQFISWLNLDLGIQTCLYKGMDSYVKVWLQFAFPFYIWLIIVVMIILAKYTKFYKIIGNNAVPVLATLVLLSYIKLFRTVTLALYSMKIECGDSYSNIVWLVDPNVDYFSLKHIILFIFALCVLIVLILPFTFVLLFLQIIERHINKLRCCHFWIKLKPFFDAYGGPYKDRYRFWSGLVLLTRLLILLTVILSAQQATVLSAIISSVAFLFSLSITLGGVYKEWYANFAESLFFLLLVIMSTFAADNFAYTATIVSVSTAFVAFIVILLFHLGVQFRNKECVKHIQERVMIKLVGQRDTQELNTEPLSSNDRDRKCSDNYSSFELVRKELPLDDD